MVAGTGESSGHPQPASTGFDIGIIVNKANAAIATARNEPVFRESFAFIYFTPNDDNINNNTNDNRNAELKSKY